MASQPVFFIDRIERKLDAPLAALYNFVDSRLDSARPGEIVTILRTEVFQDVEDGVRNLAEDVTPAEMHAVKLNLPRIANLQIIQGVITAAILDAEKAHHGRIAVKTRTGYRREFKELPLGSEVRLLAAGGDAFMLLESVKNYIQGFDVTRFDSDGFLMPKA